MAVPRMDTEWWKAVFLNAPDPSWLIQDDRFFACNEAAAKALGLACADELMRLAPWEISPEFQEDGQSSETKAKQILAAAKSGEHRHLRFEWLHKRLDGAVFPVEVSLTCIPGSTVIHCSWRDITASRAAAQDLLRHRSILESSIAGLGVAAFTIDSFGIVTQWNTACERLTGIPAREVVGTGRHWMGFYADPRPTLADFVAQKLNPESIYDHYKNNVKPSTLAPDCWEGTGFFPKLGNGGLYLHFTASPLLGPGGEVCGAIETLLDVTEKERAIETLIANAQVQKELALTDKLTGIGNKRNFDERISSVSDADMPLCIAILDVDDFKSINDTYGHCQGDCVLQTLGGVLRSHARSLDVAFRYGGEEFAVVMRNTSLPDAMAACERLRAVFSKNLFRCKGRSFFCTFSAGVAQATPGKPLAETIEEADQALYLAKRSGKNQCRCAPFARGSQAR